MPRAKWTMALVDKVNAEKKLNSGYDFIRTHPRFISLMQRVGLAPP